jgi:cell wall-associated NlpC family hydrolase
MKEVFDRNLWLSILKDSDKIILSLEQIQAFNKKIETDIFSCSAVGKDLMKTVLSEKRFRTIPEKERFEISKYIDSAVEVNEFAITVKRSSIRSLPVSKKLITDNKYNDRIQESGVEIGEGMRVLLRGADERWLYVCLSFYRGWIRSSDVAFIDKETLFNFLNTPDFYVVTGNYAFSAPAFDKRTTFIPFGMGAKLVKSNAKVIDGEEKSVQKVIKIQYKGRNGKAVFKDAYLLQDADVSDGFLPFTRRNILKESFKLIGARYGWGDSFQARDCSSTVRSIYKTMGLNFPRNTSEQEKMPIGTHVSFENLSVGEKEKLLDTFQPGDLLFMKGHVMIYLGKHKGEHYIFHNFQNRFDKKVIPVNGVSITPVSLQFSDKGTALSLLRSGIKF